MSTDERWLDGDEQAAWRGWLDTYRLLIPVLDRQLQVSRVSFTEYEVLVCLSEATDQRLRMSEVADRTLATRSAITRTVDRLVARGWVRRVRSLQDQRGAYAALTESGAQALADLAPGHVKAVRDNLIDLLTPAELEALRSIGRRVKGRLAGRDGWSPRISSAASEVADEIAADEPCADLIGGDRDGCDRNSWGQDTADQDTADQHTRDQDTADQGRSEPAETTAARPEPEGPEVAGSGTIGGVERVATAPDR